jgi:chemotaxis protein MotB
MARGTKGSGTQQVTIVRREETGEAGHHGGAWKVAYADFVTAMMAFFLLMWLLNATTDKQRRGIAEYFSPADVLGHNASGNGQPFAGHTPFDNGSMVSDKGTVQVINGPRPPVEAEDDPDSETPADPHPYRKDVPTDLPDAAKDRTVPSVSGDMPAVATPAARRTPQEARQGAGSNLLAPNPMGPSPVARTNPGEIAGAADPAAAPPPSDAQLRAEAERRERQAFDQAAKEIRDAVRADPKLADLARQLAIDMTPEGLRIQIMDEDRQAMFASGSAAPNDRARLLLQKIAPVLMRLPEPLSIAGHTDAAPFAGSDRTNWELSAERANATRRMLTEAGLPEDRVRNVTGNADRDPLLPADPLAAANRRIAIVVLRSATPPAGTGTAISPLPAPAPSAAAPRAIPSPRASPSAPPASVPAPAPAPGTAPSVTTPAGPRIQGGT